MFFVFERFFLLFEKHKYTKYLEIIKKLPTPLSSPLANSHELKIIVIYNLIAKLNSTYYGLTSQKF